MRAVEGSLPILLQGVSQQIQASRLDGQVAAQLNMMADPVTGIRRRTGSRCINRLNFDTDSSGAHIQTFYVDEYAGGKHVVINTSNGRLVVFDNNGVMTSETTDPYLITANVGNALPLQTVSLAGSFYIMNPNRKVQVTVDNTRRANPETTGFFFTRTGAFSKSYSVSVLGRTATYTTPDGTNTGDASKSTPEYITSELVGALTKAGISVGMDGAYAWIMGAAPVNVSSPSGRNYLCTSNQSLVQTEQDLPAKCGDTYMCAVGTNMNRLVWYVYNAGKGAWDESGAFGYGKAVRDVPVVLDIAKGTLKPMQVNRSESGDSKTNEDPQWIKTGIITGIGAYQGRLVFLSDAYVSMSAVGKPEWWHRRTVTIIDPTDRIDIASGSATSAVLRTCFQFNKDLIIMGDTIQAVIPAGNTMLSPETAVIVVTGEYQCDSTVTPALCGPTILYTTPRTTDYFGVAELVPSQYTQSQYTSMDVTAHIPRYLEGRCRKLVASTTSNLVVALSTTDPYSMFIHEYFFAGSEKVQAAWHKWTFTNKVESVHFGRDKIWVVESQQTQRKEGVSNSMFLTCIDPQARIQDNAAYLPYIDLFTTCAVVDNKYITHADDYVDHLGQPLKGVLALCPSGDFAGENTGIRAPEDGEYVPPDSGKCLILQDGYFMDTVLLGFGYVSLVSPTNPQIKDGNGNVVNSTRTKLLRYRLSMQNSGAVRVVISDDYSGVSSDNTYTPVLMNSPDLELNTAMAAKSGKIEVPCRVNASTGVVELFAADTHDMNITGIEYIVQHSQKLRRM